MIENADAEDLPGMDEPLRAVLVFPAWSGIAGRVIVNEYNCGGAVADRRDKNLAGVHDRCAQAPDGNENFANQLVFGI